MGQLFDSRGSILIRDDSTVPRPPLRNKPMGMAWVKMRDDWLIIGADACNGAAVCTVELNALGNWAINPPVSFVAQQLFSYRGVVFHKGSTVTIEGMCDEYLEPWKDIDLSDELEHDEQLPAPLDLVSV